MLLSEIIENKIKVSALEYYQIGKDEGPPPIDYEMWAYPDGIKITNEHFQIINDKSPEFTFSH